MNIAYFNDKDINELKPLISSYIYNQEWFDIIKNNENMFRYEQYDAETDLLIKNGFLSNDIIEDINKKYNSYIRNLEISNILYNNEDNEYLVYCNFILKRFQHKEYVVETMIKITIHSLLSYVFSYFEKNKSFHKF